MCSPMVLGVASFAMGAMGAYQQYQMGQYNAQVAENQALAQRYQADMQAQRLESDAESVMESGWAAERQSRIETARLMGAQRAAFAGSGVELSDTALGVIADTKMEGERDSLTIRSNAAREAYGMQTAAQDARYVGDLGYGASMAEAERSRYAGTMGAGSSLLGAATSSYGLYQGTSSMFGSSSSGMGAPSVGAFDSVTYTGRYR